jgi:hypothetical protein
MIKIMTDSTARSGSKLTVANLVGIMLNFNEFMVHDAAKPYGVGDARTSTDLLEGSVFLDGYLW